MERMIHMRSLGKIIAAALLLSLLLAACAAPATPQNTPTQEPTEPGFDFPDFTEPTGDILYNKDWDGKTLKILAIGNSFSVDAMTYLYNIATAHGVENVVLGNLYVAGCSLSKHQQIIAHKDAAYKYYKNTNGNWEITTDVSLQTAIAEEDWNIISMQQASAQSGTPDSYSMLEATMKLVKDQKDLSGVKFVWHMTWAYPANNVSTAFGNFNNDQMTMYQAITDAVQSQVVDKGCMDVIMASGTAIQTARKHFGDTLNRDKSHLNELGQFIAGYTWFVALTGAPVEELKFIPKGLDLSEADKEAILHAVNEALFYPFQVS